tara:strand:+ start:359 stop:505 length:147 start_codon:yes stop_codon:yes gene_type:complete
MKYLVILIAASAVSTAGSYLNEGNEKTIPVEYIEFFEPIYITPNSLNK